METSTQFHRSVGDRTLLNNTSWRNITSFMLHYPAGIPSRDFRLTVTPNPHSKHRGRRAQAGVVTPLRARQVVAKPDASKQTRRFHRPGPAPQHPELLPVLPHANRGGRFEADADGATLVDDEIAANGDHDCADTWRRITAAVERLADTPPGPL